jgi:hypothetical protein
MAPNYEQAGIATANMLEALGSKIDEALNGLEEFHVSELIQIKEEDSQGRRNTQSEIAATRVATLEIENAALRKELAQLRWYKASYSNLKREINLNRIALETVPDKGLDRQKYQDGEPGLN